MPEAYKVFGVQRMLSGIRDSQNDFNEYIENSLEFRKYLGLLPVSGDCLGYRRALTIN